jgi:hypothetical protein
MSMRKHPGRSRALRPSAEGLEDRRLLSGTVTGMNTEGDVWTLTLSGKGSIQVVKQNDSSGSPAALNSATEIKSITISGTDPSSTRLTETIKKAAGGTGKVFFQQLTELPNKSERAVGGVTGLGIQSINIPDFYLGATDPTMPASSSTSPRAEIFIPDGINSLRFGGVDATAFFGTDPTQSPTQDNLNDEFRVRLGVPAQIGTSIVVNSIVSAAQAGTTSSSGTAGAPTQKSVVFDVTGRLNLFQANEIDGNTQLPPAAGSFSGGTIVASFADPTSSFSSPFGFSATGLTGALGFIRVGGNATNFSAVTNDRLANFYIGGEANNVSVLTPNGSRNFYFGKGLDTTTILTHSIENIFANRGIINSEIVSERMIGDIMSGGDVVNSTILSGYDSGLAALAAQVEQNLATTSSISPATDPTPTAHANGMITAFVSGNVTNSVFAASVQPISQLITPTSQIFGNPQDAFLPLGKITAKVQGTINNATATPDNPTRAFYAQTTNLTRGPVAPPKVVEPPLPPPATPVSLPGIPVVFPSTTTAKSIKKK